MALILIVDDDLVFRTLLSEAVMEMGHEVITAADGLKGLDAARARPPHIIISDIMMPEMDGVELNTQLQLDSRTKGIPILMLTGDVDKHMEVSQNYVMDMYFEYIVGKTAPLDRIMGIVREMLLKYYQL